jgi:cell division septal protein FtsQ
MRPGLGTPRQDTRPLHDLGERSAFVGGQRVGRARRRRARTRQRLARVAPLLIAAALAATAVGLVARWLLVSPHFMVAHVDVLGGSRVSGERILELAAVPSGANIFRVDTDAIVARVEALPEIRRVEVIRALPDRLTILVQERQPFTLVHAGRLHWIDEDGHVLGEERQAVVPEVPVISGLTEAEVTAMRTAPSPKAEAGIALIRTLLRQKSTLAAEISEIDVAGADGPVLFTVDGIEVRLGPDGWEDRLARLEGVLGQVAAQDRRIRTVDLRFRDQVVLKRGGQS